MIFRQPTEDPRDRVNGGIDTKENSDKSTSGGDFPPSPTGEKKNQGGEKS